MGLFDLAQITPQEMIGYSSLASIFVGLCVLQFRLGLKLDHLVVLLKPAYRARELSALITYITVLLFFIFSTYLEDAMLKSLFPQTPNQVWAVSSLALDDRRLLFYFTKSFSECAFIGFLAFAHYRIKVRLGVMAKIVVSLSFAVAMMHFARGIDRSILHYDILKDFYTPSILALNLVGSIAMAFYIPALEIKDKWSYRREF